MNNYVFLKGQKTPKYCKGHQFQGFRPMSRGRVRYQKNMKKKINCHPKIYKNLCKICARKSDAKMTAGRRQVAGTRSRSPRSPEGPWAQYIRSGPEGAQACQHASALSLSAFPLKQVTYFFCFSSVSLLSILLNWCAPRHFPSTPLRALAHFFATFFRIYFLMDF